MRDIKVKMEWTSYHEDFEWMCAHVCSAHLQPLIWHRYFLPLPAIRFKSFGLISHCCCSKLQQTERFKQCKFAILQFWWSEVWYGSSKPKRKCPQHSFHNVLRTNMILCLFFSRVLFLVATKQRSLFSC